LTPSAQDFPNCIAKSGGDLGDNRMDHHMGSGASGEMPVHEDKMPFGNRPNGIYIPRFRNVKTKHRDFLRGYGYQRGASREGWTRGMHMTGLGAEVKNSLKMPGPWHASIGGFGAGLPKHTNDAEVQKDTREAWAL